MKNLYSLSGILPHGLSLLHIIITRWMDARSVSHQEHAAQETICEKCDTKKIWDSLIGLWLDR
jgi:hypothetical protein